MGEKWQYFMEEGYLPAGHIHTGSVFEHPAGTSSADTVQDERSSHTQP